jgi:hypothetical protein
MRRATPLSRVRLSSNKVVPFALDEVGGMMTVGELRRAVHARLHAPLSYLAVVSWKPDADTLIFHRGDQVRGALGSRARAWRCLASPLRASPALAACAHAGALPDGARASRSW